jgi:hypothetical protein
LWGGAKIQVNKMNAEFLGGGIITLPTPHPNFFAMLKNLCLPTRGEAGQHFGCNKNQILIREGAGNSPSAVLHISGCGIQVAIIEFIGAIKIEA